MTRKKPIKQTLSMIALLGFILIFTGCSTLSPDSPLNPVVTATVCAGAQCSPTKPQTTVNPTTLQPTVTSSSPQALTPADTPTAPPTPTTPATGPILPTLSIQLPTSGLPNFSHVIVILLENREYTSVVGNTQQMPNLNRWIGQYTLLSQYFAVSHPSLPNYLALMGGSTFDIQSDCNDCFVNAPSLPDQIEASQRTWKTYQENMPSPVFQRNQGQYAQKHNPFAYFDPIRSDTARCKATSSPHPN